MWPILFKIWKIPIRMFGVTAAIGFLFGIWVATIEGRRQKLNTEKMQDVAIWLFVGVIGGGRLLFVIVNWRDYIHDPIEVFKIWKGGLVLYGGLIGSISLGMWRLKVLHLPFWKTTDIFFVGGMLGLAIARVGCLCVGDDWGRVAPAITILFPSGEYAAGTLYSWDPMDPGRAKPDIDHLTEDPQLLYDERTEIVRDGPGPDIDFRGYCKEPCPMRVRIGEGSEFEYSTDGGVSFSEPLPIPEARFETPPDAPEGSEPIEVASGDFVVPGTKLPWAIRFPTPKNPDNLLDDSFVGEWLHPTQLYLSANVLFLFGILSLRQRTGKRFDGELIAIGMMFYPVTRFIIENYRGDIARGGYGGLSTSQWVGIPWFLLGVALYILLSRKARRRKALAQAD
ncbi:MAG: prolipoprotein diacylglyceryl transferase [Planctomycetota bacterium]|nr:prolipoprotein diacylglyceryl transferase [Planctomycetota bacterium]